MSTTVGILMLELAALIVTISMCQAARDADAMWKTSGAAPKNDAAHDVEANNDAHRDRTLLVGAGTLEGRAKSTLEHAHMPPGRGGSNL